VASLQAIREGLAANMNAIPGLAASPWLLSNPTPPAAEIQPSEIEFDQASDRGFDRHLLIVRVFVAASTDRGAQNRLDQMLAGSGAYSVKAAIEADRQLGGACDDLLVMRCSGYRVFSREGMPSVLGAEWEVQVIAAGD
jgi:hypothetical protein